MVHTAVPYASFASASNYANSEGGLWDVFDGNGRPGSFIDYVSMALLNGEKRSAFSGEVYGDVDVNTFGEPGTILNFFWSFQACAAQPDGAAIITSVGSSTYADTLPDCVSDPTPLYVVHTGTVQIDNEGNIRIILSSSYDGQGSDNASVYISGFQLELTLESSSSSSLVMGDSPTAATLPSPIYSTAQHIPQSSAVDTVITDHTSPSPSATSHHFSPITTLSQSRFVPTYTQSSLINATSTSLPNSNGTSSSAYSQLSLIVGGTLIGFAVLVLLAFLTWKYRSIWKRRKIGEEQWPYLQGEKSPNSSGREHNITETGRDEFEVGRTTIQYGYGWGQDILPTTEAYGLEVSEKSRGGVPPPFPLTEPKEKQRLGAYYNG